MIELAQLEEMFAGMRSQTPWNIDGPMLWGYFFTDASQDNLTTAAALLKAKGYSFWRFTRRMMATPMCSTLNVWRRIPQNRYSRVTRNSTD